jgi:acetyl/propionyl-CoA carboxylase alpha subunit
MGAAPAADSYLSTTRLLDAAKATGADAVHPGYGFLAENADFAAACERAGLTFVGPPWAVIAQMGSKIEARRLMQTAGVPVVPGETPEDQSDEGIGRAVAQVGFPALIKASAGGGGKGMRRVGTRKEVGDAIQAARREATAAFGDGTLYVERLIERPRHIEVQIFGDEHGQIVHLFERECSVQRRHQKIIEESPSTALTAGLRDSVTSAAVRAAQAAGYRNAGTIEFLLEGAGNAGRFYFLEMNTRLQVEHPVTEQVTGTDLVRAQLLVASHERLPWTQYALAQRGHAIEARVYAEDPSQDFVPQAGRLLLYREPTLPGVRIDSGVVEGGAVTVHYDPLIAKVVATAETRDLAIARLMAALRAFPILGIRTNIAFLLRILDHPRFRAGQVDTGFLDGEGAALAQTPEEAMPAFVGAAIEAQESPTSPPAPQPAPAPANVRDPWSSLREWRM